MVVVFYFTAKGMRRSLKCEISGMRALQVENDMISDHDLDVSCALAIARAEGSSDSQTESNQCPLIMQMKNSVSVVCLAGAALHSLKKTMY